MLKLFVVGCSRSGTTALQYRLVENFDLYSIPETWFFKHQLLGPRNRLNRVLRFTNCLTPEIKTASTYLGKLAQCFYTANKIGWAEFIVSVASKSGAINHFSTSMDEATIAHGRRGWLEKSPRHFENIDLILKAFPEAYVIFMLRDGREVVASIVDRAKKFPEEFPGQADPSYAIDLWNSSVSQATRVAMSRQVILVGHEQFCVNPIHTMSRIGGVIGCDPIDETPSISMRIRKNKEQWKQDYKAENFRPQNKWTLLFDKGEQAEIERKLNLHQWGQLKAAHGF